MRDDGRAVILERKRQTARPHGERQLALRIRRAVGQPDLSGQRLRIDGRLGSGGQVDHPSGGAEQRQEPLGQQVGSDRIDGKARIEPVLRDRIGHLEDAGMFISTSSPACLPATAFARASTSAMSDRSAT